MQRRTKIIIAMVLAVVIGLPMLWYISLVRAFGSSAGDYYKITGMNVWLMSQRQPADSLDFKLFGEANQIDTSRQVALCIFLNTDFYSQNAHPGTALIAAREPGRRGSKEKIQSISCSIINPLSNEAVEITNDVFMPPDMQLFSNNPEHSVFKSAKVQTISNGEQEVMLFDSLEDFQFNFNSFSSYLTHVGLGSDPMLFYIKKEKLLKIRSPFKIATKLTLSDNSVISAFTKVDVMRLP